MKIFTQFACCLLGFIWMYGAGNDAAGSIWMVGSIILGHIPEKRA